MADLIEMAAANDDETARELFLEYAAHLGWISASKVSRKSLTVAKDHPWDVSGSAVPRLTRAR
jgi:hypothetical protein